MVSNTFLGKPAHSAERHRHQLLLGVPSLYEEDQNTAAIVSQHLKLIKNTSNLVGMTDMMIAKVQEQCWPSLHSSGGVALVCVLDLGQTVHFAV